MLSGNIPSSGKEEVRTGAGTGNHKQNEAQGQKFGRRPNGRDRQTIAGFRAGYRSHCESSMVVMLFRNKHNI